MSLNLPPETTHLPDVLRDAMQKLDAIERDVAKAIAGDARPVLGYDDLRQREAAGCVLHYSLQARQMIIRAI